MVGAITLADNWGEGKFDVNINRCYNCYIHFKYSWHSEDEFVTQFNELGDAIQSIFPNANIIGNHEIPDHLAEFEVYVRGLGFKS